MGNLLFSINNVFPIFIVILTGFFFREIGMLDDNVVSKLNLVVFRAALPALVFMDIISADLIEAIDVKFTVFVVLGIVASFSLIWLFTAFLIKDKSAVGSFVQGSFRGNYALLGLPLIKSVINNDSTTKASFVAAFIVVSYNVLSVVILTLSPSDYQSDTEESDLSKKASKAFANSGYSNLRRAFLNILTNPLIIAISISVIFSLFHIKLPTVLASSLGYFSNLASPLALLAIGASLTLAKIKKSLFYATVASCLKLVILPTAATVAAYIAGFRNDELMMIFLIFGLPSAISSFTMAHTMGGDTDLAAGILVQSSLLSAITLTLGIYLLKSFGLA